MPRNVGLLFVSLIIITTGSWARSQEATNMKDWPDAAEKTSREFPRLESDPGPELEIYETELRYRMIVQMIGFILGLGVLHLIQAKLKIHRGYFWFMVIGVILLFVLNSHRAKFDPTLAPSAPDEPPTYAPTHAR